MISTDCTCGTPHSDITPNPDCERCCLVWTVHQVKKMRASQASFFKTRDRADLEASKRLERVVDQAMVRLFDRQPSLFDTDNPPHF